MKIAEIVRTKGGDVVTIRPEQTVQELLALLAEYRIGAVVVSADGEVINGIVSERDIVRHLHSAGPGVITGAVSAIMTAEVFTCTLDDQIDDLESTMTERRIRHVPIVEDGKLQAIVSIGDVVKTRILTLQSERDQLVEYINQ